MSDRRRRPKSSQLTFSSTRGARNEGSSPSGPSNVSPKGLCLGTPVPLGIVPMGTANVFAREVGLPRSSDRVASTLMNGKVGTIPIGQINGQPVLFVVGVGFDAESVRQFETASTRKLGQAGFVGPVVHALFSQRNRSLHIVTDRAKNEAEWVIGNESAALCRRDFFYAERPVSRRPNFMCCASWDVVR
jgi:Diacylglycerol kinase catalytic domain